MCSLYTRLQNAHHESDSLAKTSSKECQGHSTFIASDDLMINSIQFHLFTTTLFVRCQTVLVFRWCCRELQQCTGIWAEDDVAVPQESSYLLSSQPGQTVCNPRPAKMLPGRDILIELQLRWQLTWEIRLVPGPPAWHSTFHTSSAPPKIYPRPTIDIHSNNLARICSGICAPTRAVPCGVCKLTCMVETADSRSAPR